MHYESYTQVLIERFQELRKRRLRYSMRAFARDLGIAPSHLSDILSGRRGLSSTSAKKIAEHLKLEPYDRDYFLDLVSSLHARNPADRASAAERLAKHRQAPDVTPINKETEAIFDHWFYSAVWRLLSAESKLTPPQIARRLEITEDEVLLSLRQLEKMQIIKKTSSGYDCDNNFLFESSTIPKKAIRGFHIQLLKLAAERIETVPQAKRKNLSGVISFNTARAEEARTFLQKMYEEFMSRFQDGESGNTVYAVSLNIFQLDQASDD